MGRNNFCEDGNVVTGLKGCSISSYLLANFGLLLTNSSEAGSLLDNFGDDGAEDVDEAGEEGSEKAGE